MLTIQENKKYGIAWDPNKVKKIKTSADQNSSYFKSLTEHERVFIASHIYGGPHASIKIKLPTIIRETNTIAVKEITVPDLLARIYLELLSNATDNILKSRLYDLHANYIKVVIGKRSISVTNDGFPIPIEPHEELCKKNKFGTTLDLIFGKFGAGSNNDSNYQRRTAGTNATGAKLANVFSTEFIAEVGDKIRGVLQKAIWTRNMCTKVSSVCTPNYIKKGNKWILDDKQEKYKGDNFVTVKTTVDMRKFENDKFVDEDIDLFKRFAIDASFSTKVPIIFNDETLDYRDIKDYCEIIDPGNKERVFYNKLNKKDDKKGYTNKEIERLVKSGELLPEIEMCLICKPNSGFSVAFTNGIYNRSGGTHVKEVYEVLKNCIKAIVENDKSYGITKEEIKKLNVTLLKKHIIVIINYRCKDANFESQMKHELTNNKPNIPMHVNLVNQIKKWNIMKIIYESLNTKEKVKKIKTKSFNSKFKDCNLWKNKKLKKELYVGEGTSVLEYINIYIITRGIIAKKQKMKGGLDTCAAFALTGKIKNIYGLEQKDLTKVRKDGNKNVLTKFMDAMGLSFDVDYSTKKGLDSLRYDYINIVVDADHDGSHIMCLLIYFMYIKFIEIIKAGRVRWVSTPIKRAVIPGTKKTLATFYEEHEFEKWAEKYKGKYEIEYYKGLASSSPKQAAEDARTHRLITLVFDKKAEKFLKIAFDKEKGSADIRKNWFIDLKDIKHKNLVKIKNNEYIINISDTINFKLRDYMALTLTRSLPSIQDQFKYSIRIIIAYMLTTYKFGKSKDQAEKMNAIANGVSKDFKYHHGEVSLAKAGSRLSLDYAGSNNLPFLTHDSMIGSREVFGKNCGDGRYTKAKLEIWAKYLCKEYLYDLVKKNVIEGKTVEPEFIPLLLPYSIMNGFSGVSVGWSSKLENYHPGDVAEFVYRYISGKKVFPMIPWFIDFKGNVYLEYKLIKRPKDFKVTNENKYRDKILVLKTEGIYKLSNEKEKTITVEEDDEKNYGKKITVTKKVKTYDIRIKETPVHIEPELIALKFKKLGFDVHQKITDINNPGYMIYGYYGETTKEKLSMIDSISMSNITFLSKDGIPVKYDNIYQVIVEFCENLKLLFKKRREILLESITSKINVLSEKAKIIKKVYKKEWTFIHRARSDILKDLRDMSFSYNVFKSINSDDYSLEGYEECKKELNTLKDKLNKINETDYLQEWKDDLLIFINALEKDKRYTKLEKHEYKKVKTNIEDLLSGKVYAPTEINKIVKYTPKVLKRKDVKSESDDEDEDDTEEQESDED